MEGSRPAKVMEVAAVIEVTATAIVVRIRFIICVSDLELVVINCICILSVPPPAKRFNSSGGIICIYQSTADG